MGKHGERVKHMKYVLFMYCLCLWVYLFVGLIACLIVCLLECFIVFFFSCIDIAAKVIPSTVVMSVVTKYSKNEKL